MRHPLLLAFAAVLLLYAGRVTAADPCPCVPVTHLWTVKSCTTFDCAAAAFVLGAGSPDVIVIPTGSGDAPWIVLERVVSGSSVEVPDPTFTLDSYDKIDGAAARFAAADLTLRPIVMSTPDGKFLVVTRRAPEARRRAIGH